METTSNNHQPETHRYEAPACRELGSVVELTRQLKAPGVGDGQAANFKSYPTGGSGSYNDI